MLNLCLAKQEHLWPEWKLHLHFYSTREKTNALITSEPFFPRPGNSKMEDFRFFSSVIKKWSLKNSKCSRSRSNQIKSNRIRKLTSAEILMKHCQLVILFYLRILLDEVWWGTSSSWSWASGSSPRRRCWSWCSAGRPGRPCGPLPGSRELPRDPEIVTAFNTRAHEDLG